MKKIVQSISVFLMAILLFGCETVPELDYGSQGSRSGCGSDIAGIGQNILYNPVVKGFLVIVGGILLLGAIGAALGKRR